MAIVKLEHVNSGMVVANNVKDRSGRILISINTELTDKHIRILKTWGIRSVEIVTADQKIEEELTINISAEQLTEAKNTVDMLFKNANRDHPVIKELIAFATQRLARKLGTKTNGH